MHLCIVCSTCFGDPIPTYLHQAFSFLGEAGRRINSTCNLRLFHVGMFLRDLAINVTKQIDCIVLNLLISSLVLKIYEYMYMQLPLVVYQVTVK